MTMNNDARIELTERLTQVIIDYLSPHIFTGTGQQAKERGEEAARIMARVSAVVMYDDRPESEQAALVERLERAALAGLKRQRSHIWVAK